MTSKEQKPEISIDLVKDVVKRYKNKGLEELSHHDLAIGLTTIGFKEVCKEFGAQWTEKTDKDALERLVNSEYDLSWFGKVNNPLYVSFLQLCSRGDIEKIKQFIFTVGKKGKSELISTTDNFKRTALHLAVKESFDVLAEYLVGEGFSLNARDRELKTPLHYCKSQLICQSLLKKGANVTLKDNKNCTIAHYAASGSEYKVLQMILKKTNIVNEVDVNLKTPLFYSIYNSSAEQVNVIRVFLQNGARVNDQDMYGKTALHYASELGRTRCIPFLLQKGANVDIRDKNGKTPLDLCSNEKVAKLFGVYRQSKGIPSEKEQKVKRLEFSKIAENTSKQNVSKVGKESEVSSVKANPQIYTKEVNQVSTWVRQKFFVLMKKLQESGIKSLWHMKRPYIYTGSWAEDIESLESLYESFINISGAEAAMRTFNILCPYQKPFPVVVGKSEEAFQSFFGENWFSNDPVQKIRNIHSQSKIRGELEQKIKQNEDLKTELLGYRSEIEKLQGNIIGLKDQLSHYEKVEEDLRKERAKNTQQYTQILKHMNQISTLKEELAELNSGEQKTQILSKMVEELRSKNEDLKNQINQVKVNQAAARRKCGQLFLKSLALVKSGEEVSPSDETNLFDDDAIINLYELLRNNPPNLEKRFKLVDRRGTGKLNIEQFTKLLQNLSMLPQDVMSMHRITGFSQGRKTLSLAQFKTILENRHKNRPMWEKQLIRKIKTIILSSNITLDKFFEIIDTDGSGTVEPAQLRKGLEDCNIFMNQTDWSNLFNLLDADKSGTIQLEELKTLFQQETTGKLDNLDSIIKKSSEEEGQEEKEKGEVEDKKSQPQVEDEEKKQSEREQKEEEKEESEPEEKGEEEEKSEEKSEEKVEQPKPQNDLLSQQFKEQYQEQDSQAEAGIHILNGKMKVQVPILKNLLISEQELQELNYRVYIRFIQGDNEIIKMADLKLQRLKIAIFIDFIEYKVLDLSEVKLNISVYKTREFDEDNYLGQFEVELDKCFEMPNDWGMPYEEKQLIASQYEKEVSGVMAIQVKWIPKEE